MAFFQGLTFWLSCMLVEKLKPVVDYIDGDDVAVEEKSDQI
jgi:hypothetical protein